jgi:hypothetical protein
MQHNLTPSENRWFFTYIIIPRTKENLVKNGGGTFGAKCKDVEEGKLKLTKNMNES